MNSLFTTERFLKTSVTIFGHSGTGLFKNILVHGRMININDKTRVFNGNCVMGYVQQYPKNVEKYGAWIEKIYESSKFYNSELFQSEIGNDEYGTIGLRFQRPQNITHWILIVHNTNMQFSFMSTRSNDIRSSASNGRVKEAETVRAAKTAELKSPKIPVDVQQAFLS